MASTQTLTSSSSDGWVDGVVIVGISPNVGVLLGIEVSKLLGSTVESGVSVDVDEGRDRSGVFGNRVFLSLSLVIEPLV